MMTRVWAAPRALLATALALTVILMACSSDDDSPQSRRFDLVLRGGVLVEGAPPWRVNEGDTVTMTFNADQTARFHLHGYDIERTVTPRQSAQFTFLADATGSFPITVHLGEEADGHSHDDASSNATEVEHGRLEVLP